VHAQTVMRWTRYSLVWIPALIWLTCALVWLGLRLARDGDVPPTTAEWIVRGVVIVMAPLLFLLAAGVRTRT